MIQKISYSLSTKVNRHLNYTVKIHFVVANNVNVFTIYESRWIFTLKRRKYVNNLLKQN